MNAPSFVRARLDSWRALVAPASPTLYSALVAALFAVALALLNGVLIVQAVNLYHAFAIGAPLDRAVAMRHGADIFTLERHLRLAVEPRVQHFLSQPIHTPFGALPAAPLHRAVVWIYLNALPAWLFAALTWSYLYKQRHFPVLRDLTIVSILCAVVCYRMFPVAPPRFVLRGAPYNLSDWTYGATSIDTSVVHVVGFNPYAAFPSVHFLWALIPALCLAIGSGKVWVWLAALCYPLTMLLIVVTSGNHYILDCAGSLAMLGVSWPLVVCIHRIRWWTAKMRRCERYEIPSALGLCIVCAGTLAVVAARGDVRFYIAMAILILVAYATGRSPYLWGGRRRLDDGRQAVRPADYIAGFLFVAGATGAAHAHGRFASLSIRACAALWLLACIAALYRHVTARQPLSRREYDLGDAFRQLRSVRRAGGKAMVAAGGSAHAPWSVNKSIRRASVARRSGR